jgi:DNA-binding IscR family transcriptional regulator
VHLARQSNGAALRAIELSHATAVPLRELERVLCRLRQAGLVEAESADLASYRLKSSPWGVSLLSLYKLMGEQPFGSRTASSFTWASLAGRVESELAQLLNEISIGRLAAEHDLDQACSTASSANRWVESAVKLSATD